MIATAIDRPPKPFPSKQAWKSTWSVVTLTDLGKGQTQVRAAMFGLTLKLLQTWLEAGVPQGKAKE